MNNDKQNFHKIMKNKSLSIEAKGIYSYMYCVIKDKEVVLSLNTMAKDLALSKQRLNKYINELVTSGFLTKRQTRVNGKLSGNAYKLQ